MSGELSLSTDETREFISLEGKIARGKQGFESCIEAFAVINEKRYFRGQFNSFREYLEERWGYSQSYIYRLISHAEVVRTIQSSPIGENLNAIPNESQARELNKLPPEQQPEAFQEACEESKGKPTAKAVKKAVEKRKLKDIDTDETSRPHGETSFEPPTPKESSLEVNTLKELIENEREKLTVFRWLWDSMLPWQRAKLSELIELWSE